MDYSFVATRSRAATHSALHLDWVPESMSIPEGEMSLTFHGSPR